MLLRKTLSRPLHTLARRLTRQAKDLAHALGAAGGHQGEKVQDVGGKVPYTALITRRRVLEKRTG